MTAVPYKVGDTWPPLGGTCTDEGAGISIAGALEVELHLTRPDDTVVSRAVVKGDQVTEPGSWSWALESGDLDQRGEYLVEVQVSWDATRVQTFPQDSYGRLYVLDELA